MIGGSEVKKENKYDHVGRPTNEEVKARKNARFGYGREAVNEEKLFKITSVAQMYLKKKKLLNAKMRFDVIEIMGENITHLKAVL